MSEEAKPPREWWIDRGLAWRQGETRPGHGVHVIEKSYVDKECISRFLHEQRMDAVVKERDDFEAAYTVVCERELRVEKERDEWKSEHDNLSKFAEDLRKERDALSDWNKVLQRELDGRTKSLQDMLKAKDAIAAQLAEANRQTLWHEVNHRACDGAMKIEMVRRERLERALAYAKAGICEMTANQSGFLIEKIERLERGDG